MQPDYDRAVQEAERLYNIGDRKAAFEIYMDLGNKGYDEAQIMVGWSYAFGLGTSRDVAEAIKWFQAAADQGNPKASWYLGRIYCDIKDFEAARKCFESSAGKGFGPSFYRLAQLYHHGAGVQKDRNKAFEILKQGADAGNLRCQALYARGLMIGRGGLGGIVKGFRLLVRTFIESSKIASKNEKDIRVLS